MLPARQHEGSGEAVASPAGSGAEPQSSLPGVSYSARYGARCPNCGTEGVPAYCRKPWSGDMRVRHHRCQQCGGRFKSVQVDPAYGEYGG
jgi:ribosomal protein L32